LLFSSARRFLSFVFLLLVPPPFPCPSNLALPVPGGLLRFDWQGKGWEAKSQAVGHIIK